MYTGGTTGNDISYPQCSTSSYPQNSFGIVGVAGGRAFTDNSCLSSEYAWAHALSTPASLYMNLNSPIGSTASNGYSFTGGPMDLVQHSSGSSFDTDYAC
jgi:hypothetical protein